MTNLQKALQVIEAEKKRNRKHYRFVCYKDKTKKGISIKAGWQDVRGCSCCEPLEFISPASRRALTKLADEVTSSGRFLFKSGS